MSKNIKIDNRLVGLEHPPFIIAEMSGNHNQSLERALKIVEAAAKVGVQALKLQTYTADTLTIDTDNKDFFINDTNSIWHGQSLYNLYQQAYTPWEWHKPIIERCSALGLIAFSTPFDETAVDFLEDLDVPAYKIASFENNHMPLIRKVAKTGKPVIISTGMATIAELDETVRTARGFGCEDIILMKCTSTYPASPENSNLVTIPHLRQLFNIEVGLSDHTLGIGASVASIALGATVIEKHFTLLRADGGVDSAFSMEPDEMGFLVENTYKAWKALGKIHYGPTEEEKASMTFRSSLHIIKNMKAGEKFTPDNLKVIRPGKGLAPKYLNLVMGRQIKNSSRRGTPVTWENIL
jgi:N-acetylneuraminate synthase